MLIGVDASRALRAKRTGTERYALEIIRHLLAEPAAAQHQWRLYVDNADTQPLFEALPPQVEVRCLPARRLWTHRALAQEIVRHPPDVLFVPAHVIPFVLPPSRLPPSVVTLHDLGYHHVPEAHTHTQRLYLEWSSRWSARAARTVIAVSQATADDLSQFYHTPPQKIRVIHEAHTPLPIASAEQIAALRQRYGLTRPYLLYLGTIQPRKNLARLVRAYASLQRDPSFNVDLVCAGAQGWLSKPLVELSRALHLTDQIHWLGYLPEQELPALFQGALGFCLPSLFEGFGLPVLEAQAYGVPVMTANNSSLPEVAGDAALLVDPTDVDAIAEAMLRLSQDEALRQQLIAAGHENVKRFSWEKAARATLAVLLNAAQRSK